MRSSPFLIILSLAKKYIPPSIHVVMRRQHLSPLKRKSFFNSSKSKTDNVKEEDAKLSENILKKHNEIMHSNPKVSFDENGNLITPYTEEYEESKEFNYHPTGTSSEISSFKNHRQGSVSSVVSMKLGNLIDEVPIEVPVNEFLSSKVIRGELQAKKANEKKLHCTYQV